MLKIGDFSKLSQVSIKALRYYDEIGLLKPVQTDRFTRYRYYSVEQLPRLNRILALKDLGLSLEQITYLLDEGVSGEQIQGLLEQKRAEIQRNLHEEQARLSRVEARLRQVEQEGALSPYEVVLKQIDPLRVAAVRDVIPTYADGMPLFAELAGYLARQGCDPYAGAPWFSIYHDEGYRERDVSVTVAAPLSAPLPEAGRVRVLELPGVETMACVVYHGPYDEMAPAYTALMSFITRHRYQVAGSNRSLYLRGPDSGDDPAHFVTEIQFPVERTRSTPAPG